ncbi:hypothetical protein WEH80_01420 [Actinomycetes bacterium KLBMP 9759]
MADVTVTTEGTATTLKAHHSADLPSKARAIGGVPDAPLDGYGPAPYWAGKRRRDGLVFGYGGLTEPTVVEGVNLFADAVGPLRR